MDLTCQAQFTFYTSNLKHIPPTHACCHHVNKYPGVLTMKALFFPCVYGSYSHRPLWWVSRGHTVIEGNQHSPSCLTMTIRQRFSEVHVTLQSKWIGQCTRTGEVSRIGMRGICVGQWNRSGGTRSPTGPHL